MSGKLPRVTSTQLVRALHRAGWYDEDKTGSHLSLRHLDRAGKLIVPIHKATDMKVGTLASILEDAGLSPEEFRRLL